MSAEEVNVLISDQLAEMSNVVVKGLMGMATNTKDEQRVRNEFKYLRSMFETIQNRYNLPNLNMEVLSMGMSQDYLIALEEGSNMIRVGSTIFGPRNYTK